MAEYGYSHVLTPALLLNETPRRIEDAVFRRIGLRLESMRWSGAFLIFVAGCRFDLPDVAPTPDDSMIDPDGSSECVAWTPLARHVVPCDLPAKPAWVVSAPGGTFDTSTGMYSAGGAPESTTIVQQGGIVLRVVSVEAFTVEQGATLRVIGSHPLLVLSWSRSTIAGTINAGSVRNGADVERGAGGDRAGCQSAQPGLGTDACGGGGGGGFSTGGGRGGNGGANGGNGAGSIAMPTIVAGGCPGARGGAGGSAGSPGAGGGAIQLTAKTSIEIAPTGQINAGGAGGRAGQGSGGGGGGGSGGFIGLDAPTVTVAEDAVLAANGGGGGTGCDGGTGGESGGDGTPGTDRAEGGDEGCNSAVTGGDGGAFGASGAPAEIIGEDGASGSSSVSGGGGGGGVGYILVWSVTPSFQGTASPAHQALSPL